MGSWGKLKLPKWPWAMICIMLTSTLFSGQSGPIAHVTRMLSSAAQVSEAAGLAASTVLSAGTELTTVVTTAVLSITTTSLNIVQTSWHGVDLTNMAIAKVRGRVHVDGASVIDKWLHSPAGQAMTRCNEPTVISDWSNTVGSIGIYMPYAAVHHEVLLVTGRYYFSAIEATLLASGILQFDYDFINVTFQPQWANPAWQVFEFQWDHEYNQILDAIQRSVQKLPNQNRSFAQLDAYSVSQSTRDWFWLRWQRQFIAWKLFARRLAGGFFDGYLWAAGLLLVGACVYLLKQVKIDFGQASCG